MAAVQTSDVTTYQMYIGGRWVDASNRETSEILDPSSENVIARVPRATVADAETAVKAARAAFDTGPWPRMKAEARGETLEVPGETMSMVVREPVGVTVGITPWNYPMLMAAWKAAPSLAAGNVMILSPATLRPLANLELAIIFVEVALPEGVFQVITGPGGEIGDYLAASPLVDMVAFTGSVEVGKHIMRKGADNVKKVGLELGGKSPNIVFADADFDAAIDGALVGIFAGTGEVCSAGSRLIVERSIHDR